MCSPGTVSQEGPRVAAATGELAALEGEPVLRGGRGGQGGPRGVPLASPSASADAPERGCIPERVVLGVAGTGRSMASAVVSRGVMSGPGPLAAEETCRPFTLKTSVGKGGLRASGDGGHLRGVDLSRCPCAACPADQPVSTAVCGGAGHRAASLEGPAAPSLRARSLLFLSELSVPGCAQAREWVQPKHVLGRDARAGPGSRKSG